jgi:NhaA family Na+:H+ antiporter
MTKLFKDFFESEKSSGLFLLFCTIVSLLISNSLWSDSYISFWNTTIGSHSISHWVNDGLMAIFFLLIGLELEREIYIGELSKIKEALLPFSAAIGGMLIPALLFSFLNFGTQTQSGFGIPMATDIAFALGILSLLGNKVPTSLKIFLTALAVIDDLGAILIIALFYTQSLIWTNLIISLSIFGILLILNRLKVHNLLPYLIGGVFMWYFMLNSGIHATITGVLLAFAIPFGSGDEKSPSYILQHILHNPVAFIILPIFALANTAIIISSGWQNAMTETYTLGILFGLLLGKPIGIFVFSYLAVKMKLCSLPSDINWKTIIGVGFLAGIGFTMSIFITLLAYNDASVINNTKIMIIITSSLAGIIGFIILNYFLKKETH